MDNQDIGREPPATVAPEQSHALLDAYFDSARKLFMSAQAGSSGPVRRYFSLCGKTIELVFANEKLLPYITPALEHLAVPAAQSPALQVCIWDDVTTGTVMPAPPWEGYGVQKQSGHLEGSNVSAIEEMVATMTLNRDFELQMKLYKAAGAMAETGNRLLRE